MYRLSWQLEHSITSTVREILHQEFPTCDIEEDFNNAIVYQNGICGWFGIVDTEDWKFGTVYIFENGVEVTVDDELGVEGMGDGTSYMIDRLDANGVEDLKYILHNVKLAYNKWGSIGAPKLSWQLIRDDMDQIEEVFRDVFQGFDVGSMPYNGITITDPKVYDREVCSARFERLSEDQTIIKLNSYPDVTESYNIATLDCEAILRKRLQSILDAYLRITPREGSKLSWQEYSLEGNIKTLLANEFEQWSVEQTTIKDDPVLLLHDKDHMLVCAIRIGKDIVRIVAERSIGMRDATLPTDELENRGIFPIRFFLHEIERNIEASGGESTASKLSWQTEEPILKDIFEIAKKAFAGSDAGVSIHYYNIYPDDQQDDDDVGVVNVSDNEDYAFCAINVKRNMMYIDVWDSLDVTHDVYIPVSDLEILSGFLQKVNVAYNNYLEEDRIKLSWQEPEQVDKARDMVYNVFGGPDFVINERREEEFQLLLDVTIRPEYPFKYQSLCHIGVTEEGFIIMPNFKFAEDSSISRLWNGVWKNLTDDYKYFEDCLWKIYKAYGQTT